MKVYFISFLFLFFGIFGNASEIWAERLTEAYIKQMNIDKAIQQIIDENVGKDLQLTLGNVTIMIDIFLKQRIVWKGTFP